MLKTTKSITLSGTSVIGDSNEVAAYFNATINTDATANRTNVNMTIANEDLYTANKSAVRADQAAFQALVYETEDSLSN